MTYSSDQIITWLRANTQRDRVIQNALNNLPRSVEVKLAALPGRWVVDVVSRRGVAYRLIVVCDAITGDPVRWFREETE